MRVEKIGMNPRYQFSPAVPIWLDRMNGDLAQLSEASNARTLVRLIQGLECDISVMEPPLNTLVTLYGIHRFPSESEPYHIYPFASDLAKLLRLEAAGVDAYKAASDHREVTEGDLFGRFATRFNPELGIGHFIELVRTAVVWADTPAVLNQIRVNYERLDAMTPDQFLASADSRDLRKELEKTREFEEKYLQKTPDEAGRMDLTPQEYAMSRAEHERKRLADGWRSDLPYAAEKMRELVVVGVRDNFGHINREVVEEIDDNARLDLLMSEVMRLETAKSLQEVAVTYPPTRARSVGRTVFRDYPYTMEQALRYPNEPQNLGFQAFS